MLLHFAAILITFCVNITFCGDYYILRRNTRTKQTNAAKTLFSDNRQECDLVIRKSLDGFLTTKNSIVFFIWPQNKKINDCSASKA